jgi:hypothetical protein
MEGKPDQIADHRLFVGGVEVQPAPSAVMIVRQDDIIATDPHDQQTLQMEFERHPDSPVIIIEEDE